MKSDDASTNMECEVPIIAKSDEKQTIYGVVYAPDVVDTQGDFMKAETIETVAHDYMLKSQAIDKSHTFKPLDGAKVVESYVAPCDMTVEGAKIAKGSWVMATKIIDSKLWEQIKKGEINSYSIGGTGNRVKVKDNIKKEAFDSLENDEVKGFFNVVKSFFAGEKIEKDVNVKSFATTMDAKDVSEEGGNKVNKSELNEIFKEWVEPINKRLDSIEKSNAPEAENGEITKSDFETLFKSHLKPIDERLSRLEKAKGTSKQADDNAAEEPLRKSNSKYVGRYF